MFNGIQCKRTVLYPNGLSIMTEHWIYRIISENGYCYKIIDDQGRFHRIVKSDVGTHYAPVLSQNIAASMEMSRLQHPINVPDISSTAAPRTFADFNNDDVAYRNYLIQWFSSLSIVDMEGIRLDYQIIDSVPPENDYNDVPIRNNYDTQEEFLEDFDEWTKRQEESRDRTQELQAISMDDRSQSTGRLERPSEDVGRIRMRDLLDELLNNIRFNLET